MGVKPPYATVGVLLALGFFFAWPTGWWALLWALLITGCLVMAGITSRQR